MTIYDPPAWVMPKGQSVGYQMFDCDLDAFREMVTTVSARYKGKLGAGSGSTRSRRADRRTTCRIT